jgi:hypothetical protein
MLKLATVLDNPGEPFAQTQYRDPAHLKAMGYTGLVIYETTGLSGIEGAETLGSGEIGRWVAQQYDQVAQRINQARFAGLEVYILFDALSLARVIVSKNADQYTCRNRPTALCPASEQTVLKSVETLGRLLEQLPTVDGVVLRFGDNDAARLPYLIGNDIYSPHCPRCSQLGRADRIVQLIEHFHRLVVTKLDKRLIVRAWNVKPNGMHDSVDLCRRVCERLPGDAQDPRLVLSFKFTQTDFWRYQKWNPSSLACGGRPVIYELQCQREFEGKGGIPNWQVPLWTDGPAEIDEANRGGLKQVASQINFAGLWAWARGGGWGGPFVTKETWIDVNVFAVPHLVDEPGLDTSELTDRWIERQFGSVTPALSKAIKETLAKSPQLILQGFYLGPYAKSRMDPWHPNGDWIQDDQVDAQAAWRIIQRLPEAELDAIVLEKQQAVECLAGLQEAMSQAAEPSSKQTIEPLVNSLIYAESLFMTLRDLLAGLVAYRRYQKQRSPELADQCRRRLTAAQSHWTQHSQRHGSLSGAATSFREVHFWELTQNILNQLS